MKHTNIFSRWICLVMLLDCVGVSWGQNLTTLSNSGTWNGGTLINDITVKLTGDVTLNKRIIIPDGMTLTIQLADNVTESVSITNGASALNQMFYIRSGGTLIIEGRNRNNMDDHLYVIIDGGAKFGDWSDQSPYLTQETGGLAMTKASSSDNASAIWNRGTLSMKYAKIQNVYVKDAADSGGAIYINSDDDSKNGPTTIEYCIIEKCKTEHGSALHITTQGDNKKPETCAVTIENSIIRYCHATAQTNTGLIQGGTIRTNGKAVSNLNLKNVSFINNYSEGNGGAVYWNGGGHKDTKCTIDGCRFEGNRAVKKGGALFLETTFEFVNNLTTVTGNFAGERGGGVCVNGYNGGAIPSGDFIFNLGENLKVVNNESGTGGGISFHFEEMSFTGTSSLTAKVNGVHVEGNTATTNGGGIHLNNTSASAGNKATINISILLDKGNILNNEADEDGGGIYVAQTNISHTSENNETLTMQGNVATKNGGALFLNDGNLDLGNIEMKNNIAKENGGGICLANGALSMKEGSEIVENSAAEKGGGMYVYNESMQTNEVKFSGGTLSNNTAKLGGGICVEGLIKLTTDDTSIECNQAVNGGAICMINSNETQSVMTFGSGLIRNNVATSNKVSPCLVEGEGSTAKGKRAEDVVGVGGGVFLDSNTKLNFEAGKTFGFYGNLATNVADDIFANGNNTSVQLPDVKDMALTDFSVPTSELFWAEDYYSYFDNENDTYWKDTGYETLTTMVPSFSSPNHNLRYQYALSNMKRSHIVEVSAGTYANKYVCLALGYQIFYVTIKKTGLQKGESGVFNILKSGSNDPYITMLLTGIEGGGVVEKKVALPEGTWTVTENTAWSWSYSTQKETITKEVNADNIEFLFSNTKKDNTETGLHDEAIRVNEMGKKE